MPMEFNQLSESIFGWGWQSKLARTFKINPRTVRRWATGGVKIPENIMISLRIMAKEASISGKEGE